MSAEWSLQKAIRAALVGTPGVTSIVPAASILDTSRTPAPVPGITLGEADTVPASTAYVRGARTVSATVHFWIEASDTSSVKGVMAAAWESLTGLRQRLEPGFVLTDLLVTSSRVMKDPDGKTVHGVMQLDGKVARG